MKPRPHPSAPSPSPPGASSVGSPSGAPRVSSLRRNQILRVGLTTGREKIEIASAGGLRAVDPDTGRPLWKESYRETLMIGIRGARPTEGRIYRAQAGSFDSKEKAEAFASQLRSQMSEPVIVVWLPDRRTWRIRVGAASSREGLADVLSRLRAAGYTDSWITDEPVPQSAESTLVLVDSDYNIHAVSTKRIAVEPATAGAPVGVDGNSYRGSLEVRLDASGGLLVVNIVPIESYLRGVVPSELGPAVYPELEALKAQAIAARTYTYRNLGQFADQGYDLCDTPRCQVYGGIKVEHPLSDRAVEETEGEIATYDGEPINALYTSTCGGHTEDAAEIFPEQAAPYLAGVRCGPEVTSRASRRTLFAGASSLADAPAAAAEAAALLAVHGLLSRSALGAAGLAEPVPAAEARKMIDTIALACGLGESGGGRASNESRAPNDEHRSNESRGSNESHRSNELHGSNDSRGSDDRTSPSLAALAHRLVVRMGWQPRIDLLIGREDARSWFPEEPADLSDEETAAVAYFLREGGWPDNAAGRPDPERIAVRGDLARLLLFAARSCDLLSLGEGIVRSAEGTELKLSGKGGRESRSIVPDALLFADYGSGPVPVRRLAVVPGDKVRYHAGAGDRIDEMLLLPGRQGLSDDRYSSVSIWQVAYTAEELAKKLDDYLGSGSLVDLVPVRRGVSGRVTELKVLGTRGPANIRGFSIRTALGLRENLFTMDRQRDLKGDLRRVVFTGRGWGHGVGLCQVGAYGMAIRGASYSSILTHYYTGVTLERLP